MPTWNKRLQSLTNEEIEQIGHKFLMGWHDLSEYGFRLKGFNSLRLKRGYEPLTTDMSDNYRVSYIQSHYTENEIQKIISDYLSTCRVGDTRWTGIELFGCRFGREYTRLFKKLLGASEYRKISEYYRVRKLAETQHLNGGIGLQNPKAKAKAVQTNVQRYGVENPMQRPDKVFVSPFASVDVRVQSQKTKSKNIQEAMSEFRRTGSLVGVQRYMSNIEFVVFQKLVERFGKDDVLYSYGLHPLDKRYPFNCDFYIKSEDLFIEINAHYSHGGHWYDSSNHDDCLRVQHLLSFDKQKLKAAVRVWTLTDVEKRRYAKENHLNYLVFWDNRQLQHNKQKYFRLQDFYEWFVDNDCNYERFIKSHPKNTY